MFALESSRCVPAGSRGHISLFCYISPHVALTGNGILGGWIIDYDEMAVLKLWRWHQSNHLHTRILQVTIPHSGPRNS